MKTVRNAVFRNDSKLTIFMIAVSALMLIISLLSVKVSPAGFEIGFSGTAAVVSIVPVSWLICIIMMKKSRKNIFAQLPGFIYIFCVITALIILLIFNSSVAVLAFAIAVFLIYPVIVAILTLRGKMYNRVFANLFSGILLGCSVAAVVIICINISGFDLTTLILPLMYVLLIMNTMSFELEKPKRDSENSKNNSTIFD